MRYRRVFTPGATYFFTLVTYQRAPIFSETPIVDLFRRTVFKVQVARPFTVEAEVFLPDHIHVLWTLPDGDHDYPTRVRLIKSAFSRSLVEGDVARREPPSSRLLRGERTVWQRRYWEHTIRDERDFQAHLDYIHINPVKHQLVTAARDWAHSSFRVWVERGVYDLSWGSGDLPVLPEWAGRE